MAFINQGNDYRPLPIYYLTPLEVVCLARKFGQKRWAKCEEEGAKRLDPEVTAVAMGAEIRVALRPPKDMRPPLEWLLEAKITPARLQDTLRMIESA